MKLHKKRSIVGIANEIKNPHIIYSARNDRFYMTRFRMLCANKLLKCATRFVRFVIKTFLSIPKNNPKKAFPLNIKIARVIRR